MKTIYLAVDGVATGPHEVDESKDLLAEVKRKFPNAKTAKASRENADVVIVKTG